MYLSALLIDVGRDPDRPRPGRLWLRNPYRVHQRLAMAFPSNDRRSADANFLKPYDPTDFPEARLSARHVHTRRGAEEGFLYRVDPRPGASPVIVVQSARRPDWVYAFANAKYLLGDHPQVREAAPDFALGARLRFRLRANPTKKVKTIPRRARAAQDQPGRNGRRVPIGLEPDVLTQWLARKGETGGFALDSCKVSHTGWVSPRKDRDARRDGEDRDGVEKWVSPRKDRDTRPMRFRWVLYEGVLRVTDPGAFRRALAAGIGPGKAFGLGLLSVAPLPEA